MTPKAKPWWVENYRFILVAILLIAAGLRFFGLNNISPPGLAHDEVAHWLINRDILNGHHELYFTEAFGHEAGYHYFQTLFMVLLGDNAFSLRLPSAFLGLMLIAVSFTLARHLFGLKKALVAAAISAVLFWPVFYSRLGLRAISLPLLSSFSAYFWWRGWDDMDGSKNEKSGDLTVHRDRGQPFIQTPLLWFILASLFAGLSFYTYMASRVVPIFFLLFTAYLIIFHRPELRRHRQGVILFFLVYLMVAAPLAIYLLNNPGSEARIAEVDFPLRRLLSGDMEPAAVNFVKFLGMFGLRGDPLWRNNVALLPVFEPVLALFFYIGLSISLWRWRKQRYLFITLWLFTSALPSIVTIDAPSSIRIINALPILGLFPVIGLEVIQFFRPLSTVFEKLSPKIAPFLTLLLLIILLGLNIARTASGIFTLWPSNAEVQFVWQQGLTEIAEYIDSSSEEGAIAVGGWTPETMDPPTMELLLRRDEPNLRYFEPTQSLLIPSNNTSQNSRIFFPAILPLESNLANRLTEWGVNWETSGNFKFLFTSESPAIQPQFQFDTHIGEEITFLGYDILTTTESLDPPEYARDGEKVLNLIAYWRVETPVRESRRFFLHALADDGQILAQDDRIGAPAVHWQAGDVLLQRHSLRVPGDQRPTIIKLGVYDPESRQRLLTDEGLDHVPLEIEIAGN